MPVINKTSNMKTIIITVSLLLFTNGFLYSQTTKSISERKASKSIYVYTSDTKYSRVFVHKKNSIPPEYLKPNLTLKRVDQFSLNNKKSYSKSLFEVFSKERLSELQKSSIAITMYLDMKGNIRSVSFLSSPEITVYELEKFEESLKKNVSFSFKIEDDRGSVLEPCIINIRIQKVVDGSFPY